MSLGVNGPVRNSPYHGAGYGRSGDKAPVADQTSLTFSAPRMAALRWLIHPGDDIPPELHGRLLATLFGNRPVFFAALVNSAAVAGVVALHRHERAFLWWFLAELVICVVRGTTLVVAQRRAAAGRATPTDLHLLMALAWAVSVGTGACLTIASRDWTVIAIVCLSAAAMAGGSCLRNYAAPRFAILVILLCLAPVALAAAVTGRAVMLVVLAQVPFFLLSMTMGALRLNRLLVATMVAERDSERRALHDPLTGLFNRAGLERGFAGWRGDILLYIDLNGFKQINDIHGHAAGDALLREYGRRLQGIAGTAAIVARVGGDEFVVLGDRIMADDADPWRDTIAAELGQPFPWGGASLLSGGSIGMARGGDGQSLETLMAVADDELYRLKPRRGAPARSIPTPGGR